MHRKSRFIFAMVVALFVGLAVNLFYIIQTEPAQTAVSTSSRTVKVASTRGTIYDCEFNPLVNADREYFAALTPDEAPIASLQSATEATRFQGLLETLRAGSPASVRLQRPIAIADGVRLFYLPIRYGKRQLSPHVIGYLDNSGQHGVTGIERAYDTILNEYIGEVSVRYAVDGSGRCLTGLEPTITDTTNRSVGGVVLTIDSDIQQLIEDVAPQYLEKGAVVVMDPYTGAIRGMASFPGFQPDTVAESIENDDGALLNRAMSLYDCGSVFKIITAAAALEQGISVKQEYTCVGSITVQNNQFHCHNRLGHQQMNMTTAFAHSCNPYFIQLAQQIGAGSMWSTANAFGFGRSVTIVENFSTPEPIMPSAAELQASSAALANFSFGQGKLMTTPLHVALIVATVVNEGKMPAAQLVQGMIDENGQYTANGVGEALSIVSARTAQQLRQMMQAVITDGTGQAAASKRCATAGKTGTAETGQIGGEEPVVQSWFAGYFPADNPQYVVTVLAEDANNTDARTAPLFCEICDKLYEQIGEND